MNLVSLPPVDRGSIGAAFNYFRVGGFRLSPHQPREIRELAATASPTHALGAAPSLETRDPCDAPRPQRLVCWTVAVLGSQGLNIAVQNTSEMAWGHAIKLIEQEQFVVEAQRARALLLQHHYAALVNYLGGHLHGSHRFSCQVASHTITPCGCMPLKPELRFRRAEQRNIQRICFWMMADSATFRYPCVYRVTARAVCSRPFPSPSPSGPAHPLEG